MNGMIKYLHLERFGTDEVDGINIGECYIFPKLDGTNGCMWYEDGEYYYASRNRILSLDNDNAGFMAYASQQQNLLDICKDNPGWRFYGEWLVPHSLKTYRHDAWRRWYIFDVLTEKLEYAHYEVYKRILDAYKVEYIPCVAKIVNPTFEKLMQIVEHNTYMLQENTGSGEGIVIKQYGWENKWHQTTWAKLITNVFRGVHAKAMGGSDFTMMLLEEEICNEFLTDHMVEKVISKIRNEHGLFSARNIPQLLGMAYHDLVTEELWEALKKHKSPRIDFKTLNTCAVRRVKQLKPELFGGKV